MLPVKPCNTYHAVLSGRELYRGPDGKTAFKIYFCDIIGRKEPAWTVWALSGMSKPDFLRSLRSQDSVAGVGFVTAFPHVAKIFRFGPEVETNLHVRAWSPAQMKPLDLARGEGYIEFACLAEAAIAAQEFAHWAAARTVEEYLGKWASAVDWPLLSNDKLRSYWPPA